MHGRHQLELELRPVCAAAAAPQPQPTAMARLQYTIHNTACNHNTDYDYIFFGVIIL